jgi:hypothetical protein
MIKPCMESGFTKEEKVNAYKLLIQTYLFSDNKQGADEEMYRFLKDFPEYTIGPTDTKEFINLHKTYRTDPIFRIEPFAGANYSMPYVYEYFGVGDLNSRVPGYKSNMGFTVGVNYTDNYFKDMDNSFGLSMLFSKVGYSYQPVDYTFLEGTYTELYIGLPISVRYNLNFKGIDFFVKGGVETMYLLQSKNDVIRGFTGGGDNIVGNLNLTNYHKRVDVRPLLGIGFSPKLWNVNLVVDAGYRMGTVVPVKNDLRYSNSENIEKYYFIEDKWIFNHFYLNISYVFSVYKPTKIQ